MLHTTELKSFKRSSLSASSRQLEVAVPEGPYLRTGRFNKDAMLVFIQDALKSALGYR